MSAAKGVANAAIISLALWAAIITCAQEVRGDELRRFATPRGWVRGCQEGGPLVGSEMCAYDRRERFSQITVALTDDQRETLDNIALAAARRFEHSPEATQEALDVWGSGNDCEEYALMVAELLAATGFPRGSFEIAIGFTEEGAGHAWTILHTTNGALAFDVNHRDVSPLPARELGYQARATCLRFRDCWIEGEIKR